MLAALKKCLVMLTPRERWQWAGLIPLTIAVALMEALGAAIVLWFIKLISAPSQFAELPMVRAHVSGTPVAGWTGWLAILHSLHSAVLSV